MKRYTVYNITTGIVQYVTDFVTDELCADIAAMEINNNCSLTDALCILECRADRQRYNVETGEFENTSTASEQLEYDQQKAL